MKLNINTQPLVSVIAVCYNHAKFVEENLNSIIAQSYNNLELIIIDDCSQDGSAKIIKDWIKRTNTECNFIAHRENRGLCSTLNEGLSHCNGTYLAMMACDDIMLSPKIATQIAVLEKNPRCAFSYSNYQVINEKGDVITQAYYPDDYSPPSDLFVTMLTKMKSKKNIRAFHPCSILARASAVKKIGGFREDYLQEDFYMWLNIIFRYEAIYCHDVLVKYREVEGSLSQSLFRPFEIRNKCLFDQIEVIDKLIPKAENARLKALIQAKLDKIGIIERTYLEYDWGQEHMEETLQYLLNMKNEIETSHPEFRDLVKSAITSTIISFWRGGRPLYSFYEQHVYELPFKIRLAMKIIPYAFLRNIKKRIFKIPIWLSNLIRIGDR